jgi:hypothetical protein
MLGRLVVVATLISFGCGADEGECRTGEQGCGCYGNGTCNEGLICVSDRCVTGDGSSGAGGDSGTAGSGAGSGESGSGGSGDSGTTASGTGGEGASGGTGGGGAMDAGISGSGGAGGMTGGTGGGAGAMDAGISGSGGSSGATGGAGGGTGGSGGSAMDGGGDASSDAAGSDCGADGGAPSDGSADDGGSDAGYTTVELLPVSWVTTVRDGLSIWGPWIAAAPGGDVLGVLTMGYQGVATVFGEGEPNETSFEAPFQTGLAWFDGQDGSLLRARQVTSRQNTGTAGSAHPEAGLFSTADGHVFVAGAYHHRVVFFPGTPQALPLSGEFRVVGDEEHRAEEPYLVRYASDGTPAGWVLRASVPVPLDRTWFNNASALAPDGDGGVYLAGSYEYAGFTLGVGTPGAVTLNGTTVANQYWLARIDGSGVPLWAYSIDQAYVRDLAPAPQGHAYMLASARSTCTYLVEGPTPLTPVVEEGLGVWSLIRVNASGGIEWQRLLSIPGGYPNQVRKIAGAPDGSVAAAGVCDQSAVELRDEAGDLLAASAGCAERQSFVARFDADGAVSGLTLLPVGIGSGSRITMDASNRAWLDLRVADDAGQLSLGGEILQLPASPSAESGNFTLLAALDADGTVATVRVLGHELNIRHLASAPDGSLLATGSYSYDSPVPYVAAPGGGFAELPPDAEGGDFRVYFLRAAP